MYDKFGLILRIEVTVNDVTFFKQFGRGYLFVSHLIAR
jgi:hypothetical protein